MRLRQALLNLMSKADSHRVLRFRNPTRTWAAEKARIGWYPQLGDRTRRPWPCPIQNKLRPPRKTRRPSLWQAERSVNRLWRGRFNMRRREFITLLGGTAAWPLAARAQQPRLPTVGFVGAGTPSTYSQWVAAFVQRLRELAWIDGRNLAIEYRWAEGRNERYAEAAAELVRLKVDVIVTAATPATLAAKQATSAIPIVFV